MSEQQVVVVFDVEADDHTKAAQIIADTIGRDGLFYLLQGYRNVSHPGQVESWWFPETADKPIDGNDNGAYVLVPDTEEAAELLNTLTST